MAPRSRSRSRSLPRTVRAALAFRRGGIWQQRRQDKLERQVLAGTGSSGSSGSTAAGVAATHVGTGSRLAQNLLQRWSLGALSAREVQQLALAAVEDGLGRTEVRKLAALGSSGQSPQNSQRDLLRWLDKHWATLPAPVAMALPLQTQAGELTHVCTPFVPLHRMIAHMCQHWTQEFELRIAGRQGALEAFWQQVAANDPRMQHWEPFLQKRRGWQKKALPFALHGDGVPVFKDIVLECLERWVPLGHWFELGYKVPPGLVLGRSTMRRH